MFLVIVQIDILWRMEARKNLVIQFGGIVFGYGKWFCEIDYAGINDSDGLFRFVLTVRLCAFDFSYHVLQEHELLAGGNEVWIDTSELTIPFKTLPNTTWRPSSQGVCFVVMKNWDPFVSFPALAIDSQPAP